MGYSFAASAPTDTQDQKDQVVGNNGEIKPEGDGGIATESDQVPKCENEGRQFSLPEDPQELIINGRIGGMLPAPAVLLPTPGQGFASPNFQFVFSLAGLGFVIIDKSLIIRIGDAGLCVMPVMEPARAKQMEKVPENKND